MKRLVLLSVFLTVPAQAQPIPPGSGTLNQVVMEPVEVDTIGCRFVSWTLTAAGTATVTRIGIAGQADSTPSAIIATGPTLNANTVTVQLAPDTGCATSGCRNGNSYQVRLRPVAGTDYPTCNLRVDVRKVTYSP